MPSSSDRKRLEVPTYLHERLVEIAVAENRTVASVVQEILTLGLSHYQARPADEQPTRSFNDQAVRVLGFAHDEGAAFNHNYVGTEHLLLGLLREPEGVAAQLLGRHGVALQAARDDLRYYVGRGSGRLSQQRPYVPRAQRVLRLAAEEAARFGSPAVGPEHLLLALTEVPDGVGARMLARCGVLDAVRRDTLRLLLDRSSDAHAGQPPATRTPSEPEPRP